MVSSAAAVFAGTSYGCLGPFGNRITETQFSGNKQETSVVGDLSTIIPLSVYI